ncbi:DL-glycerol-3-phosphatase [Coemansia pectinata]|uniref:DL-glycerol-3-phosphatase n=1 Tax=Coemansia pectinata TaxID=1052879 RepID=A0A9W8H1N7_9FUNG|nr:DL-glycerol-3-phosphatase [Coemansia pectinata]
MSPTTLSTSIIAHGLIFDLDGTLISTLEVTEKIYTQYCRQFDIDPAPVLAGCHGIPTLQVLRMFYPPSTHTQEFANQMEHDSVIHLDGLQIIPGADSLLRSLPLDKWSIFTSGMPMLAHPRIKHLKLPMPPVFITPENITMGKPHPEGYVLAARTMGMDPKHCVVFEDAVAGVVAGRDSKAVVVGIRTLLTDRQLKDAGATYTVKDMTKVAVALNPDGTLTVTIDES